MIPPKSTNIFIHRQRDGDDLGCLVIRSASSFLLNGHYVISKTSTSIKFEGKFIDYIVNDTDEIIKSPGNFSQQLEIQVRQFYFYKFSAFCSYFMPFINYVFLVPGGFQEDLQQHKVHLPHAYNHSSATTTEWGSKSTSEE